MAVVERNNTASVPPLYIKVYGEPLPQEYVLCWGFALLVFLMVVSGSASTTSPQMLG